MFMQQLIYASRPCEFSENVLTAILETSLKHNPLVDITGALICRSDIYLQLLEGPVVAVETLMDRILGDTRHTDVTVLVRGRVEDRLFASWSMKYDPDVSLMWSREEVREGAPLRASAREVRSVFVRSANHAVS